MCGIAGFVSRQPDPSLQARVAAMQAGLIHRGPDGGGNWADPAGCLALAMRRLSIIDLASGWQPLYNEDQSLILIANGEIYNNLEIRAALSARHHFKTGSDCETILHLYEEYGDDCVLHLRGMFAFALFDTKSRRLLLARDRMGEKPLYLYKTANSLVFSSELRSLLRSGAVPLRLDPMITAWYFHYGYPPEPATLLQDVVKLPAGSRLTVDLDSWAMQEQRYWRLEDAVPIEGDPIKIIRDTLEDVARVVIHSDVPVGIALSGGLDSSVIAALTARTYPGTLEAFSVGYPGRPAYDERKDARQLTDYLGLPLHEVELDAEEMVAHFPALNAMRDDPIADIAGWAYYAVMRAARARSVPVMLQGQGGDELFWGYDWVRIAARENQFRKDVAAGQAAWPRARLTKPPAWRPRALARWLLREQAGLGPTGREARRLRDADPGFLRFLDSIPDFTDGAMAPLTDKFRAMAMAAGRAADPRQPFAASPLVENPAVATTRAICATYLAENGIAQGDRLSMAASVELRLPLIDYRLVETVIGLRKTQADRDLALPAKAWLREAMRGILPDFVLNRPKRGFQPPVAEWETRLFARYGRDLIQGRLVEHGVLTEAGAASLALGHRPAYATVSLAFKALVLESWLRGVIDAAASGALTA